MRDPKRIAEISGLIQALWYKYPDLRVGQLLEWINLCRENTKVDYYYVEDDEWIEVLNYLIAKDG